MGKINDSELAWEMKRIAQEHNYEQLINGTATSESMLLLRPHRLRGVRVEWPDDNDLFNEDERQDD